MIITTNQADTTKTITFGEICTETFYTKPEDGRVYVKVYDAYDRTYNAIKITGDWINLCDESEDTPVIPCPPGFSITLTQE